MAYSTSDVVTMVTNDDSIDASDFSDDNFSSLSSDGASGLQ